MGLPFALGMLAATAAFAHLLLLRIDLEVRRVDLARSLASADHAGSETVAWGEHPR
jgi:hypothetical protein